MASLEQIHATGLQNRYLFKAKARDYLECQTIAVLLKPVLSAVERFLTIFQGFSNSLPELPPAPGGLPGVRPSRALRVLLTDPADPCCAQQGLNPFWVPLLSRGIASSVFTPSSFLESLTAGSRCIWSCPRVQSAGCARGAGAKSAHQQKNS